MSQCVTKTGCSVCSPNLAIGGVGIGNIVAGETRITLQISLRSEELVHVSRQNRRETSDICKSHLPGFSECRLPQFHVMAGGIRHL